VEGLRGNDLRRKKTNDGEEMVQRETMGAGSGVARFPFPFPAGSRKGWIWETPGERSGDNKTTGPLTWETGAGDREGLGRCRIGASPGFLVVKLEVLQDK